MHFPSIFISWIMKIPEDASAKVFILKPSKKATYNACPIIENTVRVIVKDQMLAETGRSLLQLEITKGEDTLVTFEQPIEVKRNFVEGDVPESENEAGWIDKFIKGMEESYTAGTGCSKGRRADKTDIRGKASEW